uniref:DHHA1 domain-containing protein n=1 Tax=Nelumbo nucifera TaxID=4432 RepID=A0A822YYS9_NELNU|nr:TPA_asm: hypothetical protein HUJ06_006526 [Nelumbo nucifera]
MFLLSASCWVEDLPLDEINDVYLLDFVGPSGFVQAIASKVERIVILDHHKTALEMLNGNTSVGKNVIKVIDMERSGATIAYDYFKKNLLGSGKISNSSSGAVGVGNELLPESSLKGVSLLQMFKYIEDADLWRWALPDSKAFSSGMKDMNIEYNVKLNPSLFEQPLHHNINVAAGTHRFLLSEFHKFEQLLKLDLQSVINQGMGSLSQKQKLIDEVLEQSFEIELGGGLFGRCLAVHGDSISDLRSELGNQLANKSNRVKLRGIGAVVYRVPELQNDQLLKISLRSLGSEDTTPISQKYGGGGHRNASSFMLSSDVFDQWKVGASHEAQDSQSKSV